MGRRAGDSFEDRAARRSAGGMTVDPYPETAQLVLPNIVPAIRLSDGKPLEKLAGNILSIEIHTLEFRESQSPPNPNWVRASKVINIPAGARSAAACLMGWFLRYQTTDRPMFAMGAKAGFWLSGSTLEVVAIALCRDRNADDAWQGDVDVLVIFVN